jgi:hypothetical protein
LAQQVGDSIITGTIDDITFYVMDGEGYARKKSSLTGKRVKKDPKFRRSMQSAHRLGRGSQLASKVYRSLPSEEQVYSLYKELKSLAILAIKEGKNEEEVMILLQLHLEKERSAEQVGFVKEQRDQPVKIANTFTRSLFVVSDSSMAMSIKNKRLRSYAK